MLKRRILEREHQLIHRDVLNQAKQLGLDKNLIVVGDGITDWEIKNLGDQVTFFAYTENVSRKNVVKKADFEANNFDEVVKYIEGI